jgi:hypothetical protein
MALCTTCLLGFALVGFADELVIVTQRDNALKNLSFEALKLVYLRKSLLDSNGIRWIPVNFPASHPIRQAFSLKLFKALPEDQENYWNEQYFNGIDPPQVLASEEAILRFVAMTPGAIGYVHKRSVDNRVKALMVLSVSGHN